MRMHLLRRQPQQMLEMPGSRLTPVSDSEGQKLQHHKITSDNISYNLHETSFEITNDQLFIVPFPAESYSSHFLFIQTELLQRTFSQWSLKNVRWDLAGRN
jgi:hypothetical protein